MLVGHRETYPDTPLKYTLGYSSLGYFNVYFVATFGYSDLGQGEIYHLNPANKTPWGTRRSCFSTVWSPRFLKSLINFVNAVWFHPKWWLPIKYQIMAINHAWRTWRQSILASGILLFRQTNLESIILTALRPITKEANQEGVSNIYVSTTLKRMKQHETATQVSDFQPLQDCLLGNCFKVWK